MRLTRITMCLGWLAVATLFLGNQAAGYTITPSLYYPSFSLRADLGGVPAPGYEDVSPGHVSMVNSTGSDFAASEWSGAATDVTDTWGPGGKTTSYSFSVEASLLAQLTSTSARVGRMCLINNYFEFQPEGAGSGPYNIELEVSWSGDVSGAYAYIALYTAQGWNMATIMPMSSVNFFESVGTQTYSASLPQATDDYKYNLWFYLIDEQNWAAPGNYSSNLSVEVTLRATEAEAGWLDPPDTAPVPAGLALLGSGLAALWAQASWRKFKREGRTLNGPS